MAPSSRLAVRFAQLPHDALRLALLLHERLDVEQRLLGVFADLERRRLALRPFARGLVIGQGVFRRIVHFLDPEPGLFEDIGRFVGRGQMADLDGHGPGHGIDHVAAGALRDLARLLRSGYDVGITPDGSRGPCYEAKPGALLLAKVSKSPILLLSFEFGSAWRLNSWDRFYAPKPFSRIVVRGKKISPEELFDDRTPNEAAKVVEEELMKLTKD